MPLPGLTSNCLDCISRTKQAIAGIACQERLVNPDNAVSYGALDICREWGNGPAVIPCEVCKPQPLHQILYVIAAVGNRTGLTVSAFLVFMSLAAWLGPLLLHTGLC